MSTESPHDGGQKDGLLRRFKKSMSRLIHNPAKQLSIKDIRSKESLIHQGWLRKKNTSRMVGRALDTMNIKWNMFYVVVTKKSIYYFRSETSSSFAGKFSLFGYNVVKRASDESNSARWSEFSLMIQHASRDPEKYKTYYFSCTHADEWKTWMVHIRRALIDANESLVSTSASRLASNSSTSLDQLEEPIYPSQDFTDHNSNYCKEEEIESDDDDYEVIKDDMMDSGHHHRSRKPLPLPPEAEEHGDSYVDFDQHSSKVSKQPPSQPTLDYRRQPSAPYEGSCSYDDSANSHQSSNLPTFLHVDRRFKAASSPANDVLTELQRRQQQIIRQHHGSMPVNVAPSRPDVKVKPLLPSKPPLSSKPGPPSKPVLPVKPRMMQERIYWNGSKEDANRAIKSSTTGVFLVRAGTTMSSVVLVIAAGEGDAHSVRVHNYPDGRMGLKSETIAMDHERFPTVEAIVKHYKENNIHLRGGAVEIRLIKAHSQCESSLR